MEKNHAENPITSEKHSWINPGGPFSGLRAFLGGLLVLGLGAGVFTAAVMGDGGAVILLMLFIGAPGLLTAIGALWLIDNVLAYLKGA